MKAKLNSFYLLLRLGVLPFFLLQLSTSFAPAQVDCGECPNPLVEMKNLKTEEIESLGELFQKLAREFYDWREEEGISVHEVLIRGFNFLEFKKDNPCADMYYVEMRWTGDEEKEVRHGAKEGTAKYHIQSTLSMRRAQPGEMAWVKRAIYDEKNIMISAKDEFVPKMGTVQVHHELICLKNNEVYDSGGLNLDWLPEPPTNEAYFMPDQGSDGIIVGLFDKGSIAGLPIQFRNGDVGKTIRKKETPSAFSMEVDEELYPPYYQLKIHSIRNQLGERFPNKIRVAIRVRYGEIIGGEKVGGWSVFPTEETEIKSPILYKVPECSQTTKEILEMAAFCDWSAGPPTVGQPQASQQFFIPECFDLSLTITNTEHSTGQRELSLTASGSDGTVIIKKSEFSEIEEEYSAFIVFNKNPKRIEVISKDKLLYVYEALSWNAAVNFFHIHVEEDHLQKTEPVNLFEHSHSTFHKWGNITRLDPLGTELSFIYDKQKEEIVSVEEIPAFEPHQSFRESRVYDYENNGPNANPKRKHEVHSDSYEEIRGFIGETIRATTFGGDRKTIFIGFGKKEQRTPPTNKGIGPVSDIVSSSNIQTVRWELRRR